MHSCDPFTHIPLSCFTGVGTFVLLTNHNKTESPIRIHICLRCTVGTWRGAHHYSDVTRPTWRLQSPATQLLVQLLAQARKASNAESDPYDDVIMMLYLCLTLCSVFNTAAYNSQMSIYIVFTRAAIWGRPLILPWARLCKLHDACECALLNMQLNKHALFAKCTIEK